MVSEKRLQQRHKTGNLEKARSYFDKLVAVIGQTYELTDDPVSEFAKMFNEGDLEKVEQIIRPAVIKGAHYKALSEMSDEVNDEKEVESIYKRVVSHLKARRTWNKTVHKKLPPKTVRKAIARLLSRKKGEGFGWEEAFELFRDSQTIEDFLRDLEDQGLILKDDEAPKFDVDIQQLRDYAEKSDQVLLSKEAYDRLCNHAFASYVCAEERQKLSVSLAEKY